MKLDLKGRADSADRNPNESQILIYGTTHINAVSIYFEIVFVIFRKPVLRPPGPEISDESTLINFEFDTSAINTIIGIRHSIFAFRTSRIRFPNRNQPKSEDFG